MKKNTFLLVLFLSFHFIHAQNIKVYSGEYDLNLINDFSKPGIATYQYYENENFERIYNGSFKYKGELYRNSYDVSGFYKNNKKNGKWKFIKKDNEGAMYITTGEYIDGDMNGAWNYQIIKATKVLVDFNVEFNYNILVNNFEFKKGEDVHMKGQFDEYGRFNGDWTIEYKEKSILYKDERKFKHDTLIREIYRNVATGDFVRKYDAIQSGKILVFDLELMKRNFNQNDNIYFDKSQTADDLLCSFTAFWVNNGKGFLGFDACGDAHDAMQYFWRGSNIVGKCIENPKCKERWLKK